MAGPPPKRPRGTVLVLDPFEDEDFTQDDLAEIDVIASQAITTATAGGAGLRAVSTATASHIINNSHTGLRAEPGSDSQHTQLKRKLEQVEEEVVLKSGEIRVLRDSLRAAQQEAQTHKLQQVQALNHQQEAQRSREKELLRKVQSLESELQFKDAEINDMKSRLLSDRRSSPLLRHSPRAQSSASPSGGFITKESFGAQVKTTPLTTPSKSRPQEATPPDPFLSVRPPRTRPPGGVLLGLLLQPLSPRTSLCHLLSPTSSLVSGGGDVISVTGSAVSPVQNLALTGLNMMSLSRDQSSCPGAVLLLPLLASHISAVCSSVDGPSAGPSGAPRGPRTETEEPTPISLEERGLLALRMLSTLLQHSNEVVEAVLSEQAPPSDPQEDAVSQNALLPRVLRLCKAPQTDLTCAALTALRVLVQRSPSTHQDRLRCVVREVCACVTSDPRVKVVKSCVSVLTAATDHAHLTPLLCCHEPCVLRPLLKLKLDLTLVRFLSRLRTQSSVRSSPNCPCHSEVVQVVVLILHRLWLDLRSQAPPTPAEGPPPRRCSRGRVLASLRETVLLFHWLLQNHSGFTESCRGVLHLYDQVVPALRELRDQDRDQSCYSQELALEEICRLEPDDDMETDSGS